LYDRFDLAGAYNVSRRQFTHYARNLTNNAAPFSAEGNAFPDESAAETAAFRKRIAHTGRALSALAEALANDDPLQWGRGVYLALLGRVFDVLDGRDSALPLDDLAALSKIVAEQRRAETQASELQCKTRDNADGEPGGSAVDRGRSLPDDFGELVRRLYGTNLQADVRPSEFTEQPELLPADHQIKAESR